MKRVLKRGAAVLGLASVLVLAAPFSAAVLPAVAGSGGALAAELLVTFETDEQRERYERMLFEYRCLKCQNQNLHDSDASLAGDLRREIREKILGGADDDTIDGYLVARYGDFVRYKPRFEGVTAVLWVAPFVLLAVGLAVGAGMARRNARRPMPLPTADLPADSLNEARRLLKNS